MNFREPMRSNFSTIAFLFAALGLACKPAGEKIFEKSFDLRAAREIDTAGDAASARYYLVRAAQDSQARGEAELYLLHIDERKSKSDDCIAAKKADLAANQYPRARHKYLFQMAVCLEAEGESDRALRTYNLSESAGSKQPQLYIHRALLRERLGDSAGAKSDLSRAVTLNDHYPPALLVRALFQIRTGDIPAAEANLDALKKLKPIYAEIVADALQRQKEFSAFDRSNYGKVK